MNVTDAYRNLEKMISYGFLSVGMSYGSTSFIFKTINEKELELLKEYDQSEDTSLSSMYTIALCTRVLNGRNLLKNREKYIPELVKLYRSLPANFIEEISYSISNLQKESIESAEFIEGFCYSTKSKYMWKVQNSYNMDSDRVYGVEGCNLLGVSYPKETWIIYNKSLEDEEKYYNDVKIALLISSAMNYKGSKESSTKLEASRKDLTDLRAEISKYGKDEYRFVEKSKTSWTAPLETREDIVKELNRQIRGDKDKHDLFIDKYLEELRIRTENQKKSMLEKQEAFKSVIVQNLDQEGSAPISNEDMEKRLKNRRTNFLSNVEDPEDMTFEKKDRFLTKVSPRVIKGRG